MMYTRPFRIHHHIVTSTLWPYTIRSTATQVYGPLQGSLGQELGEMRDLGVPERGVSPLYFCSPTSGEVPNQPCALRSLLIHSLPNSPRRRLATNPTFFSRDPPELRKRTDPIRSRRIVRLLFRRPTRSTRFGSSSTVTVILASSRRRAEFKRKRGRIREEAKP